MFLYHQQYFNKINSIAIIEDFHTLRIFRGCTHPSKQWHTLSCTARSSCQHLPPFKNYGFLQWATHCLSKFRLAYWWRACLLPIWSSLLILIWSNIKTRVLFFCAFHHIPIAETCFLLPLCDANNCHSILSWIEYRLKHSLYLLTL